MKKAILFSGGKDSFFALQKSLEDGSVEMILSVQSPTGDTQLHAGPEVNEVLRMAQIELLNIPHKQLTIGGGEKYLHELFLTINNVVQEYSITHLVTGDLWHPYTSGVGDMLAGVLGIKLLRPARDVCPDRDSDIAYMHQVIDCGIESIIVSVRQGNLSENFVGRKIDAELVDELSNMNVDAAGEGGEYQSFVTFSPIMKGRIVIDEYSVSLVDGKNGKEKFHRMSVNKFHVEN